MKNQDEFYLKMAFNIAADNPEKTISVGCVIVKDDKVIATGYRVTKVIIEDPLIDITYHAEHIALLIAGDKAKGSTLYTTMEPCTARRPYPGDNSVCCCDLIIKAGIKRVVFGAPDNGFGGGGAEKLKSFGIEVICL